MTDSEPSLVVAAPLRGEWVAQQTPAERVPSHGTDYLGQRYAYDFIRLDPRTNLPYRRGFWRHLLASLPAEAFLCWDAPVYSVFDGVVEAVGEGWKDIPRMNLPAALLKANFLPPLPAGDDVRPLTGNYVIVRGAGAVAFYAHLREGRVAVAPGKEVREGEVLGRVGNSGNSTMPHLHFHLMDEVNLHEASGVPCRFESYERFDGGMWVPVTGGVPGKLERIRWPEAG
jgi:hypothetical protein